MNVIIVDDSATVLAGEVETVKRAAPDAEVTAFLSAHEAYEYVKNNGTDVAFLDVRMPEMNGVALAKMLKRINPLINVVFVTAYNGYYEHAVKVRASGYIMKPMKEKDVKLEMKNLRYPAKKTEVSEGSEKSKLFVRTFGDFEVFYDGKPLLFKYSKTKEMFAYLIDRRGAVVESDTLITILWGGETDRSNYFKQIRKDLKDTLGSVDFGDILIRRRGSLGVITERVRCDYYDWIHGTPEGINAYMGEYMRQYDWAQATWINIEGGSEVWNL